MKLFSKRHNLYTDEAITRSKLREVVGGIIIFAIFFGLLGAGLVAIDKLAAQQEAIYGRR